MMHEISKNCDHLKCEEDLKETKISNNNSKSNTISTKFENLKLNKTSNLSFDKNTFDNCSIEKSDNKINMDSNNLDDEGIKEPPEPLHPDSCLNYPPYIDYNTILITTTKYQQKIKTNNHTNTNIKTNTNKIDIGDEQTNIDDSSSLSSSTITISSLSRNSSLLNESPTASQSPSIQSYPVAVQVSSETAILSQTSLAHSNITQISSCLNPALVQQSISPLSGNQQPSSSHVVQQLPNLEIPQASMPQAHSAPYPLQLPSVIIQPYPLLDPLSQKLNIDNVTNNYLTKFYGSKIHLSYLPKTQSLDLPDKDLDDDYIDDIQSLNLSSDDEDARIRRLQSSNLDSSSGFSSNNSSASNHSSRYCLRRELLQQRMEDAVEQQNELKPDSESATCNVNDNNATNAVINPLRIPKTQSTLDSRPIYPNVPYSPYASPYGSPRTNRRRVPLRESRKISIDRSGSFLQLNQYKLMDQIGRGSYGLVKLAYSEEDSTHYAMKILSKRRLIRKAALMSRVPRKSPNASLTSPLDRVYREIAVLKKLDHPNVVKLVEVLDDPLEDSLYLVFELVEKGEVLSIPTDKPLSEERAWSVFRDTVRGLEYLHYQKIIHGDIKPGNLLLGEGGVKIADLGVCNEFLGEDATLNSAEGTTPAFRAPETLLLGQRLYSGKAADIWALGATLYSLVFGTVPFSAGNILGIYDKIQNSELEFREIPKINDNLKELLQKILNKDPLKRITLPQIKEHQWVTTDNKFPLPSEDENCRLVQVSDEEINSVVKSIPKLDTLILIKTMLKNHSFQNPFHSRTSAVSGRIPLPGGTRRWERFTRAGRSNSAPGAYHSSPDRQPGSENLLPALDENVVSKNFNCEAEN